MVHEGRRYPPKAIVGLAAKYVNGGVLDPSDFSGGVAKKWVRLLEGAGFVIEMKDTSGRRDDGNPQEVAAWVFQGTPDRFNVLDYLRSGLERVTWKVVRYGDQLRVGDLVYLWVAAGKKRTVSGIVATAVVDSDVWEGPDHDDSNPFWVDAAEREEVCPRVWLFAAGQKTIPVAAVR